MKFYHALIHQKLSVFIFVLMGICLTSACNTDPQSKNAKNAEIIAKNSKPKLIEVKADTTELLFLYQDAEGQEQRVMSIKDIPNEFRQKVQVVNLKLSPNERKSRQFVQLFDVRKANVDGTFPGRVIERSLLEKALASAQSLPEQPDIIMYSTSWCGVCKKARAFMKAEGLAFVEKDIEKDRSAAKELQEKCERARVPMGGVPVIDVGGALMRGFDPQRLMSMLKSKE